VAVQSKAQTHRHEHRSRSELTRQSPQSVGASSAAVAKRSRKLASVMSQERDEALSRSIPSLLLLAQRGRRPQGAVLAKHIIVVHQHRARQREFVSRREAPRPSCPLR
jgi:hypothetical protein